MLYFCFATLLLLAQQMGKSEALENCYCVPMDTKNVTNDTEPLISKPLKVLKDCGKVSKNSCLHLCKSLVTIAQHDPNATKGFCAQVQKNITNVIVSVFSKACDDGEYLYTGLTFNKPVCCIDKKPVDC